MDDVAIGVRINNFCQMIDEYLINSIKNRSKEFFQLTDSEFKKKYFDCNKDFVEALLKTYSEQDLDKWKAYFQVKILDRHKVAALILLYLLKFNPIKANPDVPLSAIILEMCSLYIIYARISKFTYFFSDDKFKRVHFSLVKICHNQRVYLESSKVEMTGDECCRRFVETCSNILFAMEAFDLYIEKTKKEILALNSENSLLKMNSKKI